MPTLPNLAGTDVAVIGNTEPLSGQLNDMLAEAFTVSSFELSHSETEGKTNANAVVFCLNRISTTDSARIRRIAAKLPSRPIFVFPTYNRDTIDQAQSLGAGECFIVPLDRAALLSAVRQAVNSAVEASWHQLKPSEEKALRASLQSFEECFRATARSAPLPVDQIYSACEKIAENVEESNIDRWLDSLRRHHNSSYRHSMIVCGTLSFFAHHLGVRGEELNRLTIGGFLHDAGKAQIPLEILDKPGKLDPDERQIMSRHPEYSREILLRENDLDPDVVAMAVHHHEKLDGTGYPDGLKGAQLNDLVRLTAIADVYSALIEQRAYKPALPNEEALGIMSGFTGHLDMVLVKCFREFILDHATRAAA